MADAVQIIENKLNINDVLSDYKKLITCMKLIVMNKMKVHVCLCVVAVFMY